MNINTITDYINVNCYLKPIVMVQTKIEPMLYYNTIIIIIHNLKNKIII